MRPEGILLDVAGNLIITGDRRIRRVDARTGIIDTIAGSGTDPATEENVPATAATLTEPSGFDLDAFGNLFIADADTIRRVDRATGTIRTIPVEPELVMRGGPVIDHVGNMFLTDFGDLIWRIGPFRVPGRNGTPASIVAGSRSVGFSGDGGPAHAAELRDPAHLALDAAGNLFVADTGNNRVRRIDRLTGIITTVAGNGVGGSSGDRGPATEAAVGLVSFRNSLAVDPDGNLWIIDQEDRIRSVEAETGIIRALAPVEQGSAGSGGLGSPATVRFPTAMAFDASGNLYIVDRIGGRIRRVDRSTGVITTVAGEGDRGFSGDGGPAAAARIDVAAIAFDAEGNLFLMTEASFFFVTTPENRIRVIRGPIP